MYKRVGFKDIHHYPAVDGRKLDTNLLKQEGVITIRSYDDLLSGRNQHSGMPSLGAIGCYLSHYSVWRICVEKYPFIAIAEDDNGIKELSHKVCSEIKNALLKPNGAFFSVSIVKQDHRQHFFGAHFYFLSKNACKILVEEAFPIDVQVDWYMAHMYTIGKINIEARPISTIVYRPTSIQDTCIACSLPKGRNFYTYAFMCVFIIILIILTVIALFQSRLKQCEMSYK